MYCKAGSIERAFLVFRGLAEKDMTVRTTMITGFAFHGHGRKALDLFSKMQRCLLPNGVTLLTVLIAFSHSGLVEEGLSMFNNMKKKVDIEPEVKYYGCLVDLFGRSGRLVEAKDVTEKMPPKPSRNIWGAMLTDLSKKSPELLQVVTELYGSREFSNISYVVPAKNICVEPDEDIEKFESRTSIPNKIMNELENPNGFDMILVYGIGGVRKTTIAEEVLTQSKEEKLFDDTVMVRDVKVPNLEAIQNQID